MASKILNLSTISTLLLVYIISLNTFFVEANEKNETNVIGSCEYLTVLTNEVAQTSRVTLKFSSLLPQNEVGFSVEFIFSSPLSDLQVEANATAKTPAVVSEISATHWIVSVAKIKKLDVKKAEFNLIYSSKSDGQLVGVILNGDVLCGTGESKIYTAKSQKYDGHKKCKVNIKTRYEHETVLSIEEDFFSERVGLVVDVVFDSDLDSMEPDSKFYLKVHNKRHYVLINSGYITSKETPVKITLNIAHKGRPTPGISTIIMNDVALCGFAPSHHVFDYSALNPISSLVDVEELSLDSLKTLILSSNIISGCTLLVAVVTGLLAWRLTRPEEKEDKEANDEPVYANPKKY